MMFLLAPIPPIVALILYVDIARVFNIINVNALKKLLGIRGSKLIGGFLKVLGLGYVAGLTINAFVALGEEYGWRAFLTYSLANILGLGVLLSTILVGVIWGLWHIPLVITTIPVLKRDLPWINFRLALISYIASCIILTYPLYVLLVTSHSILLPAAFHGAINASWRLPQYVTKIGKESRRKDLAKMMLISVIAWGVAVALTLMLTYLIIILT